MSLVHLLRWYCTLGDLVVERQCFRSMPPASPCQKKTTILDQHQHLQHSLGFMLLQILRPQAFSLTWPTNTSNCLRAGTSKVEVVSVFDILRYWIILRWVGKKCTVWLVHGELPRNLWWPSDQVLFLLGRRRGRVSIDWSAAVVRLSSQDLNFMHNLQ